mmetsp:Transcript_12808/g.26958  ORF Transcript_12808/g.26958 Transcript_12808/m.26958 type:complete len:355 (-) Transcript_12808:482-1546(-)
MVRAPEMTHLAMTMASHLPASGTSISISVKNSIRSKRPFSSCSVVSTPAAFSPTKSSPTISHSFCFFPKAMSMDSVTRHQWWSGEASSCTHSVASFMSTIEKYSSTILLALVLKVFSSMAPPAAEALDGESLFGDAGGEKSVAPSEAVGERAAALAAFFAAFFSFSIFLSSFSFFFFSFSAFELPLFSAAKPPIDPPLGLFPCGGGVLLPPRLGALRPPPPPPPPPTVAQPSASVATLRAFFGTSQPSSAFGAPPEFDDDDFFICDATDPRFELEDLPPLPPLAALASSRAASSWISAMVLAFSVSRLAVHPLALISRRSLIMKRIRELSLSGMLDSALSSFKYFFMYLAYLVL